MRRCSCATLPSEGAQHNLKTILLLRSPDRTRYIVDLLIPKWRRMGYRLIDHTGPGKAPDADAIFIHVDRTLVPDDYIACGKRYPIAINGDAINISRTLYSMSRLNKGDHYEGAVIVKTVANHGGLSEHNSRRSNNLPLWSPTIKIGRAARRWLQLALASSFARQEPAARRPIDDPFWRKTTFLNPHHYPIFPRMKHLPAGVWENPNLIVERFLPEREVGFYFLRFWTFLGDRSISGRVGSRDPIVRISRAETPITSVNIPPELHAWRKKLGLDYGRLDYVLHDGKPILLDANKTLGCDRSLRTDNGVFDDLAEGIKTFV